MPLKRRESKKLIDYYISSITLPLDDIAVVDWETVDNGKDATKVFDHDPVVATLMTHVSKPSVSESWWHPIGTDIYPTIWHA